MSGAASVRSMAAAFALLALLWLAAPHNAWAVDPAQLSDPALQARYDVLIHELRCVQCEDNSLADSDASIATDLRREIRGMLLAGKSDQQIKDYLVSRYSEFILFRPAYTWRNAWLWGLPLMLLLIGAVIAVRIIQQRAALVDQDDADIPQS
jgi:cytochrome c-type biogenesis protein CcmH